VASDKDIKQLLKKGLTGMEAARLIIQDSLEVDHGREGFLSDTDIGRIKNSLKTATDISEYNRWIQVYRLIDYSLKDAKIISLEASRFLSLACDLLESYHLEHRVRRALAYFIPAIVTQKQYEELRAQQTERKLAELWTISNTLLELGLNLFPELEDEAEEPDEEGYLYEFDEFLRRRYPDRYAQAIDLIIQSIREGKLRPVALREDALAKLRALEAEADEIRAKSDQDNLLEGKEFWLEYAKREETIRRTGYEEARAEQNAEDILASLEALKTGSLPEHMEEQLLKYTFLQASEVAGLDLWIGCLEQYIPGLDEESRVRPEGSVEPLKVAIIQDPAPSDLDARGYYKDPTPEVLFNLSRHPRPQEWKDLPGDLQTLQHKASESIKVFLAIQAVLEAISEILGVNLLSDMETWYKDTENTVEMYNFLATPRESKSIPGYIDKPPYYLGLPKLPRLKIGRLKPTARSIQYYRERMAMALGDNWWQEAVRTLEFQVDDPDSLAQAMKEEMQADKEKREAGNA